MQDPFKSYGRLTEQDKDDTEKKENENVTKDDPFSIYPKLINESKSKQEIQNVSLNNQESKSEQASSEKDHLNIDELIHELDTLVGLNRVKGEIKALLQFVKIQELRRIKNISSSKPSLHSVFYGSPGTGKTTIARLYGKMLFAMGLLSKGHLIETDRSGLIGGYVGQTAIKTDEKIKEALGGVLFIDEAYSLSKGEDSNWDYGKEAIEIILKRMEDYRDDLVVIVAGYPEPMERFLASNEGLKSRFTTFIHFEDYSPQEMAEIFKRLCEKENYAPTPEALEFVFTAIDYNYSIRDKSFGNARYVRNLFETVIKNQALRIGMTISDPTQEELQALLPSDIPFVTSSDAKIVQFSNHNKGEDRNE